MAWQPDRLLPGFEALELPAGAQGVPQLRRPFRHEGQRQHGEARDDTGQVRQDAVAGDWRDDFGHCRGTFKLERKR